MVLIYMILKYMALIYIILYIQFVMHLYTVHYALSFKHNP